MTRNNEVTVRLDSIDALLNIMLAKINYRVPSLVAEARWTSGSFRFQRREMLNVQPFSFSNFQKSKNSGMGVEK